MNKKLVLLLAAVVFTLSSFAQTGSVLDPNPIPKEDKWTKSPLTYSYMREADAMWSKRIWRIIDLREKMNLPLSYPKSETRDRKSLMDVLWSAISEGSLTPYETDEFIVPKSKKQILASAGAGWIQITMNRPYEPYEPFDTLIQKEFEPERVIQYRIKEDWFFDKQRSVMDVRIIGIAPIIYATDDQGNIREGGETKPLFWVYFPEARWLLSRFEAFNFQNDSQRRSYDDIFQKRLFGSYIMKESNVYDRRISEYAQGIHALQESDRIKEMIVNYEHDMWEY